MSWYIWGVTSFDVPLLLDQSLICMKFSRYILTVLSVIRKLKTFWTLWPLVNPAFILTVLPSVMGGTHSVPLCSNDLCGWGFASDFRIHHFLFLIRQPPALPCRLQHSTIGLLAIATDSDFAMLTGKMKDIEALRKQGVRRIIFATKRATSTFLLSELLEKRAYGETWSLIHDGENVAFTAVEKKMDISSILTRLQTK